MNKPILDDPLFDMSKAYIVPTVFQWVAERIHFRLSASQASTG